MSALGGHLSPPNGPYNLLVHSSSPAKPEWWALILVTVGFLFFHLGTYNFYPASWCDEVTYSEPGINLANGRGLTTQIWQFQPADTFWAVNPPLYPVLLSGWIKVCGQSLLAVRAFNFTVFAGAMFLFWFLSWRSGFVTVPWVRVLLVVLAECGYGMSLAHRAARPDVLPMFLLLLLSSCFLITKPMARQICLVAISLSIPFTGLQVALYAGLASVMCLFWKRITWGELIAICAGLALGGGLLWVVLAAHGAVEHFQASVRAASHAGGIRRLGTAVFSYFKDFSAIPLMVLAFWLYAKLRRVGGGLDTRSLGLLITIYAVVPIVFCLLGDFRSYYAYMIFLPLLLGLGHFMARAIQTGLLGSTAAKGLAVLCLGGSIALGLPLRLGATIAMTDLLARTELDQKVRAVIKPSDVVFTEYMTFFEVKKITPNVFVPFSAKGLGHIEGDGRELNAHERNSVSVICARSADITALGSYFGGTWKPASAPFGDTVLKPGWLSEGIFQRLERQFFGRAPTARYQVQMFRRMEPKTD